MTRQRNDTAGQGTRGKSPWGPVLLIALLVAAAAGVQFSGAREYLQQDRLRALIASYGALAPVIYVLIYSLAPVLFLPALPLTVVGGIVFGPVWGVIYTIIGATVGASLAFLVARYGARDWVASRLTGPTWERLDREVAQHGWKVVAFTRLIPAFPFNLLNYAFGLTKVRFAHYVLASFICMLPATVAFIVFSSSLLDLLSGRVSPAALAGLVLILVVVLVPVCYRRRKARQGGFAATE
ncbi:TVP38/TMEM64 family protein [Geomonas agri]|uniref:TVP38/TMEM64 family protein n=1 Tax=Geomonas agri TaxID=2873702 RepID=UPI001CD6B60C|nr:TVP38/TMEM64 family protein [Geomonas agri]